MGHRRIVGVCGNISARDQEEYTMKRHHSAQYYIEETIKAFAIALFVTAAALLLGSLLTIWICNPGIDLMCRYY